MVLNIGVDVASEHLDIAVQGRNGVQRLSNAEAAIRRWLRLVPVGSRVAMESTGAYHRKLAELAHAAGMVVYLLDPRATRHYARSLGARGKTDRIDAVMLARMIEREHTRLRSWQPPSAQEQQLHDLLSERALLARHVASLEQGLRAAASGTDYSTLLEPLHRELRRLARRIARAAYELPDGRQALRLIMSVPGIGVLTAASLLRIFLRLARASADAVVAFVGLDPRPTESGKHIGRRRLSKHGDAMARRLLYTAAMAAIRDHGYWRGSYERERAKGLPSTGALNVVGRKLLKVAFTVFKTQAPYDPARLGTAHG